MCVLHCLLRKVGRRCLAQKTLRVEGFIICILMLDIPPLSLY